MSSFFAVRSEIVEKLKEIKAFKMIYTPLNSVNITEMSQVTPSVHVNFARIGKKADGGRGAINQISQHWAVTIACRNAQSQQNDGSTVTDEAGELLEQVIKLLSGWQPASSRVPLTLVDVSEGFSPSFAYLTAVFNSERFL